MSVLAIIAALAIEQWRPLGQRKAVSGALLAWAAWLERSFNGGERQHGVIAERPDGQLARLHGAVDERAGRDAHVQPKPCHVAAATGCPIP